MDNMEFNNINNDEVKQDSFKEPDGNNTERVDQPTEHEETGYSHEGPSDRDNPGYNNDGNVFFTEGFHEQKNGNINIQKIPVKKKRIGRVFSYIACALVAAIVGGVAGGSYVNYIVGKNKAYETPITASQTGSTNIISYSPPTSLIAKIAAEVGPAVVGVDTQVVTNGFFGQQIGQDSGSGIIFDKRGYIVTNQHVIDGGSNIVVTLPGGTQKFKAQVVGQDQISDIAVLKINADNLNLPTARFGDSSKVKVGDLAIAIGNPLGEEYAGTVTSGIVSALNRTISGADGDYGSRYKLIQTDAAINPGNSGGALINENGEVIGINSIKFTNSSNGSSVEGMGFAIPINDVKTLIDQLMKNGYVSRPYLGIGVVTITEEMSKENKYPVGVGVATVMRGSAAEAAGIKPMDVILEIEGVKVTSDGQFISELMKYKVGDSVKLKVWREGSTITVPVTLGENKSGSR